MVVYATKDMILAKLEYPLVRYKYFKADNRKENNWTGLAQDNKIEQIETICLHAQDIN